MFIAEIVSVSRILQNFDKIAEQVTGTRPTALLQKGKRPKSQDAYLLSYFKALYDEENLQDVHALRGLLHVGILCAGKSQDIEDILLVPHGLRIVVTPVQHYDAPMAALLTGDVEQWSAAIQSSRTGTELQRRWSGACWGAFSKRDLQDLLEVDPPKKVSGYLTYGK